MCASILVFALELGAQKIDQAQILTFGSKFHLQKQLGKYACVDGLKCLKWNASAWEKINEAPHPS